jgi:hypothetical protein
MRTFSHIEILLSDVRMAAGESDGTDIASETQRSMSHIRLVTMEIGQIFWRLGKFEKHDH